MRTFALFIAVLVWSCPGLAQASQSREDTQSATTVIQAGHLLDIKSGRTIDNATVVIQGDKIVSLGPPQWGNPPANLKTINLREATLLPGLIDAHTHLTFDPVFGYQNWGFQSRKKR